MYSERPDIGRRMKGDQKLSMRRWERNFVKTHTSEEIQAAASEIAERVWEAFFETHGTESVVVREHVIRDGDAAAYGFLMMGYSLGVAEAEALKTSKSIDTISRAIAYAIVSPVEPEHEKEKWIHLCEVVEKVLDVGGSFQAAMVAAKAAAESFQPQSSLK